jgi:hypothetical protein
MATREAIVLRHLNAAGVPRVPRLLGAYASRSQFHLVQEYLPGGDLLAALQARKGQGFPEQTVAKQVRFSCRRGRFGGACGRQGDGAAASAVGS